ncbi:helix-turn-helix transcriptional regulator [Bifidobacterium avesanii]|uniref:DNA-binding protein n=1 Tax=Bifidobacterium avesanii TaxID=1798157 RepID=A0A7K3TH60_9BIFI|nr:helix-turn-helix domain-containing protein [Bifidobacterium avesanii]KAB8294538.1 hypothetical protein DSM100685_0331 [Bifidobacterium avesanii]NEG78049.1 DNA-binding protein [Bifidobacterium avesanii]
MGHTNPTKTPASAGASAMLTNAQTAAKLGVTTKYLNNMRYSGRGPAFIRLSKRRVVYKNDVVEAWMRANTIEVGA